MPGKPQDLSNTSKANLIPYQGDDVMADDIYRNSTVQETELTKSVDEKGVVSPAPSLMYDGLYDNCGEVITGNTTQLDQSIYGLLSEVRACIWYMHDHYCMSSSIEHASHAYHLGIGIFKT